MRQALAQSGKEPPCPLMRLRNLLLLLTEIKQTGLELCWLHMALDEFWDDKSFFPKRADINCFKAQQLFCD